MSLFYVLGACIFHILGGPLDVAVKLILHVHQGQGEVLQLLLLTA